VTLDNDKVSNRGGFCWHNVHSGLSNLSVGSKTVKMHAGK